MLNIVCHGLFTVLSILVSFFSFIPHNNFTKQVFLLSPTYTGGTGYNNQYLTLLTISPTTTLLGEHYPPHFTDKETCSEVKKLK